MGPSAPARRYAKRSGCQVSHGARHGAVVEDDLSLGRTAAELLRCFGYGVVWRSTLDGARRSLRERAHDVVLLDLKLRGEYGADLLNRDSVPHAPPIIVVSAQPEAECRAAAAQVGATAVLHKPYAGAELLRAVADAVAA